ncbi:MAG: GFA family protein [Gammaproteobacteria bacterium]|nr:GFA family protein [Gammaproteobacteria bacterium]
MATKQSIDGQCLCGAVTVKVASAETKLGACHCNMCRRWAGGLLLAIDCGTQVSFNGEDNISVYDSSEWAERGFCKQCGSNLFYRLKDNQQYMMPPGLFDGFDSLTFDHQIFIEEKPDYYDFANDTHNMTGAEVFAAFSQKED